MADKKNRTHETPDAEPTHSEDGVDLMAIRRMLSLTMRDRLGVLQYATRAFIEKHNPGIREAVGLEERVPSSEDLGSVLIDVETIESYLRSKPADCSSEEERSE